MFSFIFGGVLAAFEFILHVALLLSGVTLLLIVGLRFVFPSVYAAAPWIIPIRGAVTAATVILVIIELLLMGSKALDFRAKVQRLEAETAALQATNAELEANIKRRAEQDAAVVMADTQIEIRYRDRLREIETIRHVPDMTLANKLALDLTSKFYEDSDVNP